MNSEGQEMPASSASVSVAPVSRWHMLYEHLLRVEAHWTAQLQHQQQRNASLVSVNGILLSFLGFGGLTTVLGWGDISRMLFLIGLGLLAAALAFGIAAMAPGVDPKMHDWLNPVVVLRLKDAASDETAYEKLAEALAKGLQGDPPKTEPQHVSVLKKRRRLIQFQIALLGFAALSIGASLIVETGGR